MGQQQRRPAVRRLLLVPLWAALSAEHVIGLLGHQVTNTNTVEVGLAAGGRFTKLPGLQSPDLLPGVQPPDLYGAAF